MSEASSAAQVIQSVQGAQKGAAPPPISIQIPQKKVDYSTILGLTAALSLIAAALIMGGSVGAFWNVPSILIVLLGTIAVTAVSYNAADFFNGLRIVKNTLFFVSWEPQTISKQLLDLAVLARKKGILSLQNEQKELKKDPFLLRAMSMVTDGNTGDDIERILGQEIEAQAQRHVQSAQMIRRAAEIAPAMGLIGTLVGLVQMLGLLDNPSTIGPSMAVALLTTFYGAVFGTVILAPLANKLERKSSLEMLVRTLIVNGASSIARQENPRRLEMLLNSELSPAQRVTYFD